MKGLKRIGLRLLAVSIFALSLAISGCEPITKLGLEHRVMGDTVTKKDVYGSFVAIHGNNAIIGAVDGSYVDASGNVFKEAGKAYIFKYENNVWVQRAEIFAGEPQEGGFFGHVAISNDYALVGSYYDTVNDKVKAGSADIYSLNGDHEAHLEAGDGNAGDLFGVSISISGNYAIIGAHLNDVDGVSNTGAAYIFKRNSNGEWQKVQKLVASDRLKNDYFGVSVSINGNYAIVGAAGEPLFPGSRNDGQAYIFELKNGKWVQVQKLVGDGGCFGVSVAIDGNNAIVGASFKKLGAGAAYFFKRVNGIWIKQKEVTAVIEKPDAFFGRSVSISGNYAIVGEFLQILGPYTGNAYIYKCINDEWTLNEQIMNEHDENLLANSGFGFAVSISEDKAVIGTFGENTNYGAMSGAAYIYNFMK